MDHPPLDKRGMPDQLCPLPQQRVDAAERVVPIVAVEPTIEDVAKGVRLPR